MASQDALNGLSPEALPAITLHHQPPKSAPPPSQRRHSLPLHYLPPNLRSANASTASLVESEEAARGEHIIDEASVAHRIAALRQLNGATKTRHRYAKSTGARNSTFNQPVIVRTYSGTPRPKSQPRELVVVKKESRKPANNKMEAKLPPVEAFSFKGIMDEIRHGVEEDLERIAEICARSKYSLSNQYEVHMPPHGRNEVMQTIIIGPGPPNAVGPTLQAIGSDDEQPRHVGRSRGGRRTKSVAMGTLETIMSSSRSSDEDKSKKKPAAVIAEEVRGRAAKKEANIPKTNEGGEAVEGGSAEQRLKHVRSKSASFASMIIDNANGVTQDPTSQQTALISEPARPQTSAADLESTPAFNVADYPISPTLQAFISSRPNLIRNESVASNLRLNTEARPSVLGGFGSWMPWARPARSVGARPQGRMRSTSHAEGSLRELLKSTEADRKGKSVDRQG